MADGGEIDPGSRVAIGGRKGVTTAGEPEGYGSSLKVEVPSPSNKYRDRVCKNIEMTGVYHTILKFPELGPDIYLTEQVPDLLVGDLARSNSKTKSMTLGTGQGQGKSSTSGGWTKV